MQGGVWAEGKTDPLCQWSWYCWPQMEMWWVQLSPQKLSYVSPISFLQTVRLPNLGVNICQGPGFVWGCATIAWEVGDGAGSWGGWGGGIHIPPIAPSQQPWKCEMYPLSSKFSASVLSFKIKSKQIPCNVSDIYLLQLSSEAISILICHCPIIIKELRKMGSRRSRLDFFSLRCSSKMNSALWGH